VRIAMRDVDADRVGDEAVEPDLVERVAAGDLVGVPMWFSIA